MIAGECGGEGAIPKLTDLVTDYVANALHLSLAMTTLMIMPQLLHKKTAWTFTRTESIKCLERRIQLWKVGEIDQ